MKMKLAAVACLALVPILSGALAHRRGDSAFGRITAVRSADVVVFAHGAGTYDLRIIGIVPPRDTADARVAVTFLAELVLNRNVRMRLEGRLPNGQLRARLFTADSAAAIQEVSVELVRAGVVQKQPNFDLKYGELGRAESDARAARRGLWAPVRR